MPHTDRPRFPLRSLLFLALAICTTAAAVAQDGAPLPPLPAELPVSAAARTADGRLQLLIELPETPAAVIYGSVLESARGLGRDRALAQAKAASQAQLRAIATSQEKLAGNLKALGVEEIYRVARAYNGIAIAVDPAELVRLRRLTGIRAIHPLIPEYPTTSTSMPFLGLPPVWNNTAGIGQSLTGTGIKIGIIDTGIDYLHANFGGTGALATYQANDTTVITDGLFPTAKVVGGTDFAGDSYNGSTPAVPDPDPMDCNGHGSHVAGIAAGEGVDSTGATYTGPYSPAAPFGTLRIGPGAAPQALLYALRVFGCGGGTNLTVQAIDWAIDPNGDTDFSDHLDVINMSLGSNYGGISSTTAVAAENAAIAGVLVAAAAGNAGDTFYIMSSPASANRAVAVAASADSGIAGSVLVVNSPAGIAGNYAALPAGFTPAPPAPSGQTAAIVQALDPADGAGPLTTDGCSAFTNAAAVAGNIALIDRGTCGFITKVQNAQAAGAIGAIVTNNAVGDPSLTLMGGTAPPGPAVTIPSVFISKADGDTLKANLGTGVNGTLAAANAGDTVASFSSRGSRLGAPYHLKPDITAPGVSITSTQSGKVCTPGGGCLTSDPSGFIPGNQTLTISGTSMATPHIAGILALLRQLHPDWTGEEIKALAMNEAIHDVTLGANGAPPKYDLGRVGAGRVDPAASGNSSVLAFATDQTGVVSVTFDAPVVGATTQVKRIRVVNHGATSMTYDLAVDTKDDAPGIAFSLPGGSTVTVPAGQTAEFDVQMSATGNQMKHARLPSTPPTQAAPSPLTGLGSLSRQWFTQEEGFVTLSQSGNVKLRVPVYMGARPASSMAGASPIVTGGANTGSTTLALSGTDVCTGTLGAGPACTTTYSYPTFDEVSLVTPLELQVVSGLDPVNAPANADIQYAGVAYTGSSILFGISTWGPWSTPAEVAFNVYIDANSDGVYDRILYNSDPGNQARSLFGNGAATGQDSFISNVFNIATSGVSVGNAFINRLSGASIDSAVFNNRVMFLAATPAALGLAPGTTKFKYKIQTCPGSAPLCGPLNGFFYDEAAGPYTWDYLAANQGLNFGGANLAQDLNGAALPVTWNLTNLANNGSLGALLLHHHNAPGQEAQVVLVQGTASADLAIAKSMSPANPAFGQNVTFTITVTNGSGTTAASGVVVADLLPAGLTYVSDDGGGAYVPATGIWTVGGIAASGTATLHITATLNTTEPVDNVAQIVASSPLDPNPANNQSRVSILAPRIADLALTMSVNTPTVNVGSPVTYTLTAKNLGSDPAYSVNVGEAFPAYPTLHATSYTASPGVFSLATGVWNLASLGSGNSATLTFTLNAPNIAGALQNTGTGSSTTSDPVNANNTASATTTVLSPAIVSGTQTVAGTFTEGATVTYTVVLKNTGTFDQQDNPGNEFHEVLPAQLSLVSATATSGTAVVSIHRAPVNNTIDWNGVITAGGTVTITITATINTGTFGQMVSAQGTINYDADGNGTNEATALTDDPTPAGAADPTKFTVLSPAALSATKTVEGIFQEGGLVTYTINLFNSGTAPQLDNPGDELTDVLPAGLVLTGATASSGTITTDLPTNTVHWNGQLAVDGSVEITITAVIQNGTAGTTIANQATIHFDADGNQTNESTVLSSTIELAGAPTTFQVAALVAIPTLSGTGLAALALLLAAGAFLALRRRSTV